MTRWAKDATEFEVSVNNSRNKDGSYSKTCRIPKPIVEMLRDPSSIKFKIKGRNIVIVAG